MPGLTETPGLLEKILTLVVGTLVLVAAFMFSLVILAVALVAGLMFWGYFWWKTRKIRHGLREQPPRQQRPPSGQVIEGEVIVVEEVIVDEIRNSPKNPPNSPDR
ncbi:MAG: hypothetical protein Q7U85_05465 [Rhodocyclaceae bacterium]|nr:hypothetical protein [Rhodocyclaceae bacterium]